MKFVLLFCQLIAFMFKATVEVVTRKETRDCLSTHATRKIRMIGHVGIVVKFRAAVDNGEAMVGPIARVNRDALGALEGVPGVVAVFFGGEDDLDRLGVYAECCLWFC
jgi:hypothetical protein